MRRFFFWRRDQSTRQRLTQASTSTAADQPSGLLTGDASQDQQSIEILLDSIAEVNSNIELEEVLEDIVGRSLQVTQAERAFVLLGSGADDLKVRIARDRDGGDLGGRGDFSRSVVKRSIEERRAGQYQVQSSQEALELGQSVFDLKLRTVMCAPLQSQGRLIGVIYVDSKATRGDFTPRDLALFEALSAQLAISLENARLHADSLEKAKLQKDAEIARRIQEHLLPDLPDASRAIDMAVYFEPAGEASGDTYDIVPLDEDRTAVFIGDVTGHGVGAALLSHAAQAAVRSYLELVPDPAEVMARLNRRLAGGVEAGMFMSAILVIIDRRQLSFVYVNAGHPPLLRISDQGVEEFGKTGMVLGVVADQQYRVGGPVSLGSGEALFLHTDGIDEAMSPARELFGVDRVKQILHLHRHESAQVMLDRLGVALEEHVGGGVQDDDITLIAVKV